MPIRFRCAYCNQLMGIARRKSGTIVRCPRCAGQVVVPKSEGDDESPEVAPLNPDGAKPGNIFDQDDISKVLKTDVPPRPAPAPGEAAQAGQPYPVMEYDVEPLGGPIDVRGIFLTPGLLVLAGILIAVLMGVAFLVGWVVGRMQ